MTRKNFHSLLRAGLSSSELLILFYLTDMCNEWGFTTQCEKTIAAFFEIDISSVYRRIRKLKSLDVIKKIECNGRIGFMINPIYCYQGSIKLRRFRVKLWKEEIIYTKSRHSRFYGPPIHSEQEFRNRAITRNRIGKFSWVKNIHPDFDSIKKEDMH